MRATLSILLLITAVAPRAWAEPTAPWPDEGVCATNRDGTERECLRLTPEDGAAIAKAVKAYLKSEKAWRKHEFKDRTRARRALGDPWLQDGRHPKLGQYYVYREADGSSVLLHATMGSQKTMRWGYRGVLKRDKDGWRVTEFGRWKAWSKRK